MLRFLKYVGNPQHPTEDTVSDQYVRSLDRQVAAIKRDRDWEAKFVLFKEMITKEREEGCKEGQRKSILDILKIYGAVPREIEDRIIQEENPDVLTQWLLLAARVQSLEDFRKNM